MNTQSHSAPSFWTATYELVTKQNQAGSVQVSEDPLAPRRGFYFFYFVRPRPLVIFKVLSALNIHCDPSVINQQVYLLQKRVIQTGVKPDIVPQQCADAVSWARCHDSVPGVKVGRVSLYNRKSELCQQPVVSAAAAAANSCDSDNLFLQDCRCLTAYWVGTNVTQFSQRRFAIVLSHML